MIAIRGLTKEFDGGDVLAVDDLSLTVEPGQLVTLLGPSGCGKTTTLRSVAGLEVPTYGEIEIGATTVFSAQRKTLVPPNKRNVGMVFQSYAIWPHMTVFKNVVYPLSNRGFRGAEARDKVMQSLELVGLTDLADRPAPNLSGGQQQRVALARALVTEPQILLLDEPLSNLDAKLRESMRQEIREIQQRLGITTLYVTHDQVEALAISDLVAVMDRGRIMDLGEPQRLYEEPRDRFVAEFIGQANVFETGRSGRRTAEQLLEFEVPGLGSLSSSQRGPEEGGGPPPAIFVRLEDVDLSPVTEDTTRVNTWRGQLVSKLFLGTHFDCVVEVGASRVRAQVARVDARVGEDVTVHIPPERCLVLQGATRAGEPSGRDGTDDGPSDGTPVARMEI